jgi:hypothetical protein
MYSTLRYSLVPSCGVISVKLFLFTLNNKVPTMSNKVKVVLPMLPFQPSAGVERQDLKPAIRLE